MRRLVYILPVLVLIALALFFVRRLQLIERGNLPDFIPSVMISKPVPTFALTSLFEGKADLSSEKLKNQVTLVNVFASWCVDCRREHPVLDSVKQAGIPLIGINYKDKPDAARQWLSEAGNPYDAIGADLDGRVGIDFGTYGVPESYLIDKHGVIRYKQTGALTEEIVKNKIVPMVKELSK